jgi:6-phosphogluconolactonase (cycloisomerase 2 family)
MISSRFLKLSFTSILFLLFTGCQGIGPQSYKANEMVYVSRLGGQLIAFEVDPQSGSLRQKDVVLLPHASNRVRVTNDGRFLLASQINSEDSYLAVISLSPDGGFASGATRLLNLDLMSEFELSSDGAFLITKVSGELRHEPYDQLLSTYQIGGSSDSLKVLLADRRSFQLCRTDFCSESLSLGTTGRSSNGEVIWLHNYQQVGSSNGSDRSVAMDMNSSGMLSEESFYYPSISNQIHSGDYVFASRSGWTMGLVSMKLIQGDIAQEVWSCDTPNFGGECSVQEMVLSKDGAYLFSSTSDYRSRNTLWSHAFSFEHGIDLSTRRSYEVPYLPAQLMVSSKGTTLVTFAGYEDVSGAEKSTAQLFAYRIKATTGELEPVSWSVPLPDQVIALATR